MASLVNQTPIPQRWVYWITSTRKEGLGILGTNPWHSGIFTSRKRNALFYRKTFLLHLLRVLRAVYDPELLVRTILVKSYQ